MSHFDLISIKLNKIHCSMCRNRGGDGASSSALSSLRCEEGGDLAVHLSRVLHSMLANTDAVLVESGGGDDQLYELWLKHAR